MSNIAFLFLPLAFSSLPAVLPFVSPSSQVATIQFFSVCSAECGAYIFQEEQPAAGQWTKSFEALDPFASLGEGRWSDAVGTDNELKECGKLMKKRTDRRVAEDQVPFHGTEKLEMKCSKPFREADRCTCEA